MQAAELFALVSGKGIDLGHVAGNASNLDGLASKRRRTPLEIKLGIDILPTVRGNGTRTYRHPFWSLAELGQAACNVPRVPWYAAMYSYGADWRVYWSLHEVLSEAAHKMSRQHGWPPRIRDVDGKPQYYRERLAEMVLDAERLQPIFNASPAVYAIYMNVTMELWQKVLSERYEELKQRYERWLEIAQVEINRRIRANTLLLEEASAMQGA